ncbi:hypothetical protein RRG08_001860 [Elysia crispata]|uniref:ADF-H domain-containing protein n=1 Tax=Elysia crispata TaxID=231223 RepID=A0AAE1A3V5_9GAST|nr:hypothetical protein RRG08_001860 [Elysia crispata]
MSHQTGITANEELKKFLAKAKNGSVRVLKVSIQDEQLTKDDFREARGSWEDDILLRNNTYLNEIYLIFV